nr:MAG TPA: hypothetical protein [Caudoviricetes sp.]
MLKRLMLQALTWLLRIIRLLQIRTLQGFSLDSVVNHHVEINNTRPAKNLFEKIRFTVPEATYI